MNARLLLKLYEFLTTDHPTAAGQGLGMPLSSSFFCTNFGPNQALGLFKPGGFEPGPDLDLIREYAGKGLLDTLHTYGCYSKSGAFRRNHAETVLEALEKLGIRVKCWTHHGDVHNIQNLKPEGVPQYHGQGDDPASPAYHLDLLRNYGVRYFWLSLGGHTNYIGNDNLPFMLSNQNVLNLVRWIGEQPGFQMDIRPVLLPLFQPQRMRDGSVITTYKRFNGGLNTGIRANSLGIQLDEAVVNWLIQGGGTMILYQHLGYGDTPEWSEAFFNQASLNILGKIAERYHQGHLYVDTLYNVLNFGYIHRTLQWSRGRNSDGEVIDIRSATAPMGGDAGRQVTLEDLAGQCFHVTGAERVEIRFNGQIVEGVVKTPHDDFGLSYWMIPRPRPVSV